MTTINEMPASPETPILEICRGETQFSRRPIPGRRCLIGGDSGCDLQLGSDLVPSRHSQIRVDGQTIWVEALADDPPLLINGRPERTAVLADGDRIEIGPFEIILHAPANTSGGAVDPGLSELTASELIDLLERDQQLVEQHEQSVLSGVEAMLDAAGARRTDTPDRLAARLDQLAIQIEGHEKRITGREEAFAEIVASLLDGQDQLAGQLGQVLSLLAERTDTAGKDKSIIIPA